MSSLLRRFVLFLGPLSFAISSSSSSSCTVQLNSASLKANESRIDWEVALVLKASLYLFLKKLFIHRPVPVHSLAVGDHWSTVYLVISVFCMSDSLSSVLCLLVCLPVVFCFMSVCRCLSVLCFLGVRTVACLSFILLEIEGLLSALEIRRPLSGTTALQASHCFHCTGAGP